MNKAYVPIWPCYVLEIEPPRPGNQFMSYWQFTLRDAMGAIYKEAVADEMVYQVRDRKAMVMSIIEKLVRQSVARGMQNSADAVLEAMRDLGERSGQ
jgi:hypothetical protein